MGKLLLNILNLSDQRGLIVFFSQVVFDQAFPVLLEPVPFFLEGLVGFQKIGIMRFPPEAGKVDLLKGYPNIPIASPVQLVNQLLEHRLLLLDLGDVFSNICRLGLLDRLFLIVLELAKLLNQNRLKVLLVKDRLKDIPRKVIAPRHLTQPGRWVSLRIGHIVQFQDQFVEALIVPVTREVEDQLAERCHPVSLLVGIGVVALTDLLPDIFLQQELLRLVRQHPKLRVQVDQVVVTLDQF